VDRTKVSGTPDKVKSPGLLAFCPGCHDGIVGRLMLEVVEELGIGPRLAIVSGVTCATFLPVGFNLDAIICCAHGRQWARRWLGNPAQPICAAKGATA